MRVRASPPASIEATSSVLDRSALTVTTIYLRRLQGEMDRTWADVAVAIGV